ncbi:NAD(P)/FAD-dependent oxidoreductase [Oceanicella actignis]|uniref:NAD(P)/FAD-dependent oxidoreductase n=1 Tax=Oceanicella actignis TaxID=1189325 RepID=UPI0011E621DD|nr:FAD-dependent oxidoreductase [Oceanicella actignis]TYO89878.1 3-phenylpropionate/trans-cinnamate dioxygenase ferredoxin reductase subunit [Oceanicella actignis]
MAERIVVIGAGQAGAALCEALRAEGHAGPIALVGEEPAPPYQRPPLSKKYLLGEIPRERLFLRPESHYAEHGVELIRGARAARIDRAARLVHLEDGRALPYDRLALTTGARARRLPAAIGGDLAGVFTLRTLADSDALAPQLRAGRRTLIVGGGYVGLEVAAVCAARGLRVTLVEAAERILGRVAATRTAAFFRDLHRAHGVDLREGVGVARLIGRDGALVGAELTDGARIEADFAVIGIGAAPDVALAEAAGLACENGVAVDEFCRSSDPDIFAAGDCASFPLEGARVRLESVQNAIDQAQAAAANMLGRARPYAPVPWFWSDQYDVKLQIAGLGAGHDRAVARPGPREGALSVWLFRGARLVAVEAMNDPRAYMTGKRWLEAGHSPDPEALADPARDLRAL